MTLVTLHGAIPVYVQVDTENPRVAYVCASDEEFFYVGGRIDQEGNFVPAALATPGASSQPLAYAEGGEPIKDKALIERALDIAESRGEFSDDFIDWPGWSWGW